MTETIERPEYLIDEHLEYLDFLRIWGETNMFGASPFLMAEFKELTQEQASKILIYWMKTFSERHKDD